MKITNIRDSKNVFIASLNAVPACQRSNTDTDWFPAVDVTETEQEYVFDVDLPGLMPEEVQLEVDNAAILISGKRLPNCQGGRWLRVERPSGVFIRRLPLPPNTTGEIYGSFAYGVMELRVPKVRPENRRLPSARVTREPAKGSVLPA